MGNLIEENGEDPLPEMCYDSPFQLGTLTSESFSERMVSVPNLLVDTHRLRLDDEHIDKMIVLCMSKRFVERARTKRRFLRSCLVMSCLMKVQLFRLLSLHFCCYYFNLLLLPHVCV